MSGRPMFKGMSKKQSSNTYSITDADFVKELRKRTGLRVSEGKAFDVLDNYQMNVGHDGILPWDEIAEAWRNR